MVGFWRLRQASRWALLAAGCLWLLLAVLPLSAQSEKPPSAPNLKQQMDDLVQLSQLQTKRLEKRTLEVQTLNEKLQQAEKNSQSSEQQLVALEVRYMKQATLVEDLRKDLRETLTSLDEFKQQQKKQEQASTAYQAEMRAQVAGLERENRTLKALAVVLAAVAAGLSIYAAVK